MHEEGEGVACINVSEQIGLQCAGVGFLGSIKGRAGEPHAHKTKSLCCYPASAKMSTLLAVF